MKVIQHNLVTIYDSLTQGVSFCWHDERGTRRADYAELYKKLKMGSYWEDFEKQYPVIAELLEESRLNSNNVIII